jgi:glutamyl-tRNA reductase
VQVGKSLQDSRVHSYDLQSDKGFGSRSQAVHLGIIGVNFKTAPISVREKLARKITIDRLADLKQKELINNQIEFVLLSTCNRIEIYFAVEAFEPVLKTLRSLFELEKKEADFHAYEFADRRAIEHLFAVSSGLDSLVVGEAQILIQVREECKLANEKGICGPTLSKLFAKAHTTGREIRESYPRFTNGFRNSISLSVMDLIAGRFEGSAKPNLLLVGAGKMIRLAVSSFDRSQFGTIVVAARKSGIKGIEADKVVQISELGKTIAEDRIDVVITATSSLDYIIAPKDLSHFAREMGNRDLLVVDISVPRNVDPDVVKIIPNVSLINIDDLKEKIADPVRGKTQSQDMANQLATIQSSIDVRTNEFISWMRETSNVAPIMTALRKKAEEIRSAEVDNALTRLLELTPEQKEVISRMSERIVRRFLAEPTNRLRDVARNGEQEKLDQYGTMLKDIFSIESHPSSKSISETIREDEE